MNLVTDYCSRTQEIKEELEMNPEKNVTVSMHEYQVDPVED